MFLALVLLLAATPAADSSIPRIGVQELHSMLENGDAVAIDVRGTVPFELGHIKGATWLPFGLIDERVSTLPKDKLIVAYCTCSKEQVSLEVLAELQKRGFKHLAALQGGYPAWVEAGFATESNKAVVPTAESGESGGGRRFGPPAAVTCDRNRLTSYAGKVTRYERGKGKTLLRIATDEDTVETVTLSHPSRPDPSNRYLVFGTPFTERDWNRIEASKGKLHPDMRAVAWVCEGGATFIDWRPGEPNGPR